MFWVTWQNAHEHIPLRFVAQFFPRTSQLLIFSCRQYNMVWISFFITFVFLKTDVKL